MKKIGGDIEKKFEEMSRDLNMVHKVIEELLPHALVKEVSTFGNSSHVVLPKEFLDKRVGIIVLDRQNLKGGGQI